MKRIPKTVQLLGHTITVRVVSQRVWEALSEEYEIDPDDDVGAWRQYDNAIVLLRQPPHLLMHAFFHELVHAVLDMMNNKLSHDEAFVDVFAGLLAQALETAK